MLLKRSRTVDAAIPTASTADIAFLLIIFFMATTIFRMESGLPVVLPRAEMGVKTSRQTAVHIFVDSRGEISIDDMIVPVRSIEPILSRKLAENTELIVGLTMDATVPYALADQIIEQLKQANALNTVFTVEPLAPVHGP